MYAKAQLLSWYEMVITPPPPPPPPPNKFNVQVINYLCLHFLINAYTEMLFFSSSMFKWIPTPGAHPTNDISTKFKIR